MLPQLSGMLLPIWLPFMPMLHPWHPSSLGMGQINWKHRGLRPIFWKWACPRVHRTLAPTISGNVQHLNKLRVHTVCKKRGLVDIATALMAAEED
jgi:hypothetical protein